MGGAIVAYLSFTALFVTMGLMDTLAALLAGKNLGAYTPAAPPPPARPDF